MTYVVKFDEGAKQMILAGLDMLVRDVGSQLSKIGGAGAQDAAAKIISIRNVAVGIEQAARFEESPELEKTHDPDSDKSE